MIRPLLALAVTALALAAQAPTDSSSVRVFDQKTERKAQRLLFWGQAGPVGQIAVSHGPVTWKDQYAKALEDPKFKGTRWRLGSDFWTVLDTQFDLEIAGKKVAAGVHYLTLYRTDAGAIELHVLDPGHIAAKKLDPFVATKAEVASKVPLRANAQAELAPELTIAFERDEKDLKKATFKIRFGPHDLSAPVSIKMP